MKNLKLITYSILFITFLFVPQYVSGSENEVGSDKKIDKKNCTCNGTPLKGKVKVVESFADFKVQIVESFPDIDVKIVDSFPDNCGEWKFVDSFPDFTIQFVTSFPDIKIKYVTSFPGMK